MTYSQRLPDQIVDKAQWFIAYFKHIQSVEFIEQLFVNREGSVDKQSLLSDLSLLESNGDISGDKFTAVQMKVAVDRLAQYDFCSSLLNFSTWSPSYSKTRLHA